MGTGTGARTKTRAVVEIGAGTRMGTETGIMTGSGRVEERGRRARNCTRYVDALWEPGEIWAEREKKT